MTTALEIAARLVALQQAALDDSAPAAPRIAAVYREELAIWTAFLQTPAQEPALRELVRLLIAEIAAERREQGFPTPTEIPPAPPIPGLDVDRIAS
jgi:hypothetical protein